MLVYHMKNITSSHLTLEIYAIMVNVLAVISSCDKNTTKECIYWQYWSNSVQWTHKEASKTQTM